MDLTIRTKFRSYEVAISTPYFIHIAKYDIELAEADPAKFAHFVFNETQYVQGLLDNKGVE